MRILIDTNVLCRLAEVGHPAHHLAEQAIAKLKENGDELCLVPQVLYEYWVVVTRPKANNGLGMEPSDVHRAVALWIQVFNLLRDERGVFTVWHELVRRYDVIGKTAHDARLVAAMIRHEVITLLTFNGADFRRYPEIMVLSPGDVT